MHTKLRVVTVALGVSSVVAMSTVAASALTLVPSGGTISQVTVSPAGDTDAAGFGRYDPQVSNDGRYVAFWSYSPNIVAGDDNGTSDVFLYDATTGVTRLISRNPAGEPANGGSSSPALSANGKFIAYQSVATDLAGGSIASLGDLVYRYNVATGKTILVSKSHTGGLPTDSALTPNISADGRYVAFASRAHDILRGDHNSASDVFRYDATTGTTIKVSQTMAGGETNGFSYSGTGGAISGNGRYVAYATDATNMGPVDTDNHPDAYVFDTQTGTTTLVSPGLDGKPAGGVPTGISDNGKIVSLWSQAKNLAAGDTDTLPGAFVYNGTTGTVKLLSKASTEWPDGVTAAATSISADGRYVTFDATPVNNTSGADAYLFDRTTSQTSKLSVAPNGADSNGYSGCASISRSGNFIGLCSNATNLVPGDPFGASSDIFKWSRS
jgi:hypothetical protein